MRREIKIQRIAGKIQNQLDKLRELDCTVMDSYGALVVIDNKIEPDIDSPIYGGKDFDNTVVFGFNQNK